MQHMLHRTKNLDNILSSDECTTPSWWTMIQEVLDNRGAGSGDDCSDGGVEINRS